MRVSASQLWANLFLLAVVGAHHSFASETETALEALKNRLPFISLDNYLYDRAPTDYTRQGEVTAVWEVLQELHSGKLQTPELLKLCEHPDAGMRALAILALVARETPGFVPVCIGHMNDQALVMPAHIEFADSSPAPQKVHTQAQTVGAIARAALERVGCRVIPVDQTTVRIDPDADSWWALRKDNPDWLGWHEFLYQRATGAVSPVQEKSKPAIKRFMTKVDALPRVTRSWLLLYLADDVFMVDGCWKDDYATEKEMLEAAQSLGAAALIEYLRTGRRTGLRQPLIDEPGQGRRFIITYAKQLFTPANADALMQLKLYTAAADADPGMVRKAVAAAMDDYRKPYQGMERAAAIAALADLGDATDRATVVKWFYDESDKFEATPQTVFLHALEWRRPREWQDMVRRIVAHPSFGRIKPMDVFYLAQLVARLGGKDVRDRNGGITESTESMRRQLTEIFAVEKPEKK